MKCGIFMSDAITLSIAGKDRKFYFFSEPLKFLENACKFVLSSLVSVVL